LRQLELLNLFVSIMTMMDSIGVNRSFHRIVVVFQGSVKNNKDFQTDSLYWIIAVKDIFHGFVNSRYFTTENIMPKSQEEGVDVVQSNLHSGFAKYMIGAFSHDDDHDNQVFYSKLDIIIATLQSIYTHKDGKTG
jgi:hypothetical protein